MQNNKTPGNDVLTKEFYKTFWNEIKCFFKVTKTITLLNVYIKIIWKALAAKLKKALLTIISSNLTAYVNKRCISESLISDIIEACEKQNIGGYLVNMDIEKAFDSSDHDFLVKVLNKFGFERNFFYKFD